MQYLSNLIGEYFQLAVDGGYFGYLLFMLPVIILSAIASSAVNSNYKKYAKVMSRRGITGGQIAELILQQNGIYDVRVKPISGNLTDHYHPKEKYIGLSEGVYNSTSVAALGIAAHEAGHAVQHNVGYAPIRFRSAILPIANIASYASWIIILIGLLISPAIAVAGLVLFGFVVLFQLVTLPVEFDASRRALAVLNAGYLDRDEMEGARKVLKAAAMTYVVALLTSLWQMLRLVLLVFGNRRD
ncbi:MAG: zinc metallopeptidase [Clostridia bacterium]|nr:zinc metallopeptidase [Clostridia bacterium]